MQKPKTRATSFGAEFAADLNDEVLLRGAAGGIVGRERALGIPVVSRAQQRPLEFMHFTWYCAFASFADCPLPKSSRLLFRGLPETRCVPPRAAGQGARRWTSWPLGFRASYPSPSTSGAEAGVL